MNECANGPVFKRLVYDRSRHGLAAAPRKCPRLHARDGVRTLRASPAPAGHGAERPVRAPLLPGAGGSAESRGAAPAGNLPVFPGRVPPLAPANGIQALTPPRSALLLSECASCSIARSSFLAAKGAEARRRAPRPSPRR